MMAQLVATMAKNSEGVAPDTALPDFKAFWGAKFRSPLVVCLLLALTTLAAYCRVWQLDFVNYDDPDYVTSNSHVLDGLSWSNVQWAFNSGHASNWHPLTWLSHMLDCQLFGKNAGAHHAVSLAFHVANTLLLFLVLRRMTGAHWRSAMVAALFGLHPLHVESVAWASERKDVLSTFFLLLCLGAYNYYVEISEGKRRAATPRKSVSPAEERPHRTGANPRKVKNKGGTRAVAVSAPASLGHSNSRMPGMFFYLLTLLLFALGLMSKPMLVTLPFLLLLLDWWPLGRLQGGPFRFQSGNLMRLLGEKVPFLALSLVSSIITIIVQRGSVSTNVSLGARSANAIVAYGRYIGKMLWPAHLCVLYPHPGHWPAWQVALSAGLLLGITIGLLWLARRWQFTLVGWLWFLGGLVPVIGIVQVGIQSMADRYMYVPVVGLFIALVWGVCELIPLRRWRTPVLLASLALPLVACGVFTFRQVGFWRDSLSLFQHAVAVVPRNYLAYHNIGFYLYGHGKTDEAMEYYQKALAINPNYEDSLNNMGYCLAARKKYAEAISYYERALRVRPNHAEVHNNLGNALAEMGRAQDAIQHYQLALKADPDHADAHNNLGIALAAQGNLDEAIHHFREALRLKPKYAGARSNLGNALAAKQDFQGAIREYEESLVLNPDDAQAHNNLGNVLSELRRFDEAIPHYLQALRFNTNNPEAHFNLGMAFVRQGKPNEARAQLAEALRLDPNYAAAKAQLDALGAPPR
jgi:protein O-mannosyl-transferase